MVELNPSPKNTNKKYLHKLVRVDLTLMVDLGFLLITFFILTTTLQQQQVMKLVLPIDRPATFVAESTSLTFILEKNDSVGYYDGLTREIKHTGFGAMRSIIQQKKTNLIKNHIDKDELTLIIKPTSKCTYKNFIDALDEVTINDCKHYFVTDPETIEVL